MILPFFPHIRVILCTFNNYIFPFYLSVIEMSFFNCVFGLSISMKMLEPFICCLMAKTLLEEKMIGCLVA